MVVLSCYECCGDEVLLVDFDNYCECVGCVC